jgi:hypothetical protein
MALNRNLRPLTDAVRDNPEIVQHPRTVRRWVERGLLTGYRCGGRVLVDTDELAAVVQPIETRWTPARERQVTPEALAQLTTTP